ncbi:MAG: class I SAM-dependent methyltransferase, partial [Acidimicrobiales bacterium]
APGVVTPGLLDLRPVLERLPWPNVRRKRCLDLGTVDGFFAFELERRGAAEVVAIDIKEDPRHAGPSGASSDQPRGAGFELAAELIGSKADWRTMSVHDLDVTEIGRFDVVVCGGLLRHLRSPIPVVDALYAVTDGAFLSVEQIELWLSLIGRGQPIFRLDRTGEQGEWFRANGTAHRHLLIGAGFETERVSKPFVVPFNHHRPPPSTTVSSRMRDLATRLLTGDTAPGILHRAVLARPQD